MGRHVFLCQSLLLSTIVLNDTLTIRKWLRNTMVKDTYVLSVRCPTRKSAIFTTAEGHFVCDIDYYIRVFECKFILDHGVSTPQSLLYYCYK